MDPNNEQAGGSDLKEWPALESSVLRALCLTVNVAGSIVKDNILDTLTKDDFSLPINRGLFSALRELHHRGEYVVLSNLADELHDLALETPEDLSLEDLFHGDPPKAAEVKKWVERLRERTIRGESPAPAGPPPRKTAGGGGPSRSGRAAGGLAGAGPREQPHADQAGPRGAKAWARTGAAAQSGAGGGGDRGAQASPGRSRRPLVRG